MTDSPDRYIEARDISHGWLEAVRLLASTPGGKAVHLLVRILDPSTETPRIRAAAQGLIDARNASSSRDLPDIETTRNTIFPASWARRNPEPGDLAAYYRDRYTKDGLLGFNQNGRGTYFGRMVAYPRGGDEEPADQLTDTVRKLRAERRYSGSKSSRYEINIYSERKDTSPMSFPVWRTSPCTYMMAGCTCRPSTATSTWSAAPTATTTDSRSYKPTSLSRSAARSASC